MTDDLEALFGTDFLKNETTEKKNEMIVRKEVSDYTNEDLRIKYLEETEDILTVSKDAVKAALEQAIMAPGEGESVSAIASLVNAHSKLLDSYNKMYMLEQKHKHNKELLAMRLESQSKMNTENNITRVTMTRETVMAELMKSKNKDKDIVDI